jgi:hypothetical protein
MVKAHASRLAVPSAGTQAPTYLTGTVRYGSSFSSCLIVVSRQRVSAVRKACAANRLLTSASSMLSGEVGLTASFL